MSRGAPKKGQFQGAWVGSEVNAEHIEALRHRCMLPPVDLVAARVPDTEATPTPERGEVVVLEEHFYHGFGLPTSDFFSCFLTFFGLQPHHLAPNAILQLAAFVVLCDGFIGIEPRLDLWRKLFFLKHQSVTTDKSTAVE
ncbi:retrotransposon ty3-gypsy subclass [Hordeum vulgare]|nr:retrotransposon ty3-gypsy subclass [Hordeum vulgare]